MRETLTDLDLSFSYMGYLGAEVMKNILSDPQSQLVRLDLKGNVLGDKTLKYFAPALKVRIALFHTKSLFPIIFVLLSIYCQFIV